MDSNDYEIMDVDFKISRKNNDGNPQFFYWNELESGNNSLQKTETVKKSINNNCPICSQPAIKSCNCQNKDSECSKGHKWFTTNGKLKLGSSHS